MLTRQHLPSRPRCALVGVASTAGAAALARPLGAAVAAPAATVADTLVRVCTAALLVVLLWAWVAALCAVCEAWRGQPRPGGRAPLRRVVLWCCGVVLAAPGAAAGDDRPAPGALDGLPLPDRAAGPAHRAAPVSPASPVTVVVRTGDCLWRLAVADLPAGASAARVTAHWQAIHRLNAGVIGPDPHLILPGQRLVLPPRPLSATAHQPRR